MRELAAINELVGQAPARTRRCGSPPTPPTRARRAAPARPGARDRDRDAAAVLRARVGGARRRARRGAARRRRPRLLRPPPAQRAPLPAAPAVRARGEDPRGEVRSRARLPGRRLFGELIGGPAGHRRRRGGRARGRAQPAAGRPTGNCAAAPPSRVSERARAGPAHARLHLQHARLRQVRRRPAALLSALAGEPQPLQRGVRRVGDGADRGRPGPLRHPPALVPAEGAAARDRASSPTTTARRR